MNIFATAVIVTYGDRCLFFTKVIERLEKLTSIKNIVLVNNAMAANSFNKLKKIQSQKLILINHNKNKGSAQGFKKGIIAAEKTKSDFIWLLDDDNLPHDNALKVLIQKWKELEEKGLKKFALLSYRQDRKKYKQAIEFNKPDYMLGLKNSFLGFHIKQFFEDKKTFKKRDVSIGKVLVAPYGGLFFHKSLIKSIGYPNSYFFLYGDDYDYSYRISQKGEGIFLMLDSLVEDLEKSFHLKSQKHFLLSNRFLKTNSKNKIMYSVRNGIIFDQNFVNNKIVYLNNALIYSVLTLIIFVLNPSHLWKFKYYIKGLLKNNDKV